MFGILGNVALGCVGPIGTFFLVDNVLGLELRMTPVLLLTVFSAVLLMITYIWIQNNVLTDPKFYDPNSTKAKKKKERLSLAESFKFIFSSKYIGLIALLVLSYGVSINLVEGIWKAKIRELYPDENAYTAYMLGFQSYQGVGAILFMIIGSNILRRVSWRVAAMFTPIMILFTGCAFFSFIFLGDALSTFTVGVLSSTPL